MQESEAGSSGNIAQAGVRPSSFINSDNFVPLTQKTKSFAQSLKEPFGHVITICDTTKERTPIFPFALGVLHWNILDPNTAAGLLGQEKEVFRRVRDEIQE